MTYILQNFHWFILLISALVFFHELGHFVVAKACGVKVLTFSIGFGPRLLSFRWGDTEYRLSLLPLGGYVKMLGEAPGGDIPADEIHLAFSHKPLWRRIAIVVAGPAANLVLAWVVYCGMFIGPHAFGDTRLGVVTPGEPAWNAGLRPGDKIIRAAGQPVRYWEELRQIIAAKPLSHLDLIYERDGQQHTATLTTEARSEENALQEHESHGKIGVSLQYLKPIVAVVDTQSPAAHAGIRTGDTVQAVQGQPVSAWHEVRRLVAQTPQGQPVRLQLLRDGIPLDMSLTPGPAVAGLDSQLFSAADQAGPHGYTGLVNKDSVVVRVDPDSPAEAAGLQPGDRLLELLMDPPTQAGSPAASQPLGQPIHQSLRRPIGVWGIDLGTFGWDPGSDVQLVWQRDRTLLRHHLRLQAQKEKDVLKNVHTTYVLGLHHDPNVMATYTVTHRVGLGEAIGQSAQQLGQDMTLIGRGVAKMLGGSMPLSQMGGPIMLFVIAEKSAKQGLPYYLRTLAMVSVNLGMINLLPVPVLDGGHLFFFLLEAIFRKPASLRLRERANMVGLVLLLLLMLLAFRNDFLRFVLG